MDILNQIAQPVLDIVLLVLVVAVVAWLAKAYQVKAEELGEIKMGRIMAMIDTGIWAAEQLYKSGVMPKEMRLDYVLELAQNEADKIGLEIDIEELKARIEAAVGQKLNQGKLFAK